MTDGPREYIGRVAEVDFPAFRLVGVEGWFLKPSPAAGRMPRRGERVALTAYWDGVIVTVRACARREEGELSAVQVRTAEEVDARERA